MTVLGTIITEWSEGKELLVRLLASDENIQRFVQVAASICAHYGFHGWLLNIESDLVGTNLVPKLLKLTKELTSAVKKQVGEDGTVIWYDAVTIDVRMGLNNIHLRKIYLQGDLSWQNELDSRNKPFFDVCDGIFLNYSWSCAGLARSINALENDSRRKDIFVGVDVWGRGTYGGGQFHCNSVICQYWSIHFNLINFYFRLSKKSDGEDYQQHSSLQRGHTRSLMTPGKMLEKPRMRLNSSRNSFLSESTLCGPY